MAADKKPKPGPPDRGDLAEAPFARLFYSLCRERLTGKLDVRDRPREAGGKIFKRVILATGPRFLVQGGSVEETLGQVLLARKKITAEQLEALKQQAGGDYGKVEQQLLSGAIVPATQIPELLALQTGVKIKQLMSLVRGVYEFMPQPTDNIPEKALLSPLSPAKVLTEGVSEYYPESRVKKEFPGIEKMALALAPDFQERLADFGLSPQVLRWLRGLPASVNLQTATRTKLMSEKAAFALFLAFYFAGLLAPEGEVDFPIGRAYQAEKEASKPEKKPAAEEKPAEKAAPAPAPKKEEPKLPIEERLDREMTDADLLSELDAFMDVAEAKDKNHFDLLGVNENTSTTKIKQVYFKLAKRFHPDSRPDLFQGEAREKVEELFTKISEAYNVIGESESRVNYARALKSNVSQADMDKATRAIEAEMEFQKAEVLLRRSAWKPALELLDRAVQLQPDEPEYRLYRAWANYKVQGIGEAANARREMENILEQRPQAADGHFFLGQIAREDGRLDDAERYFEQAAKLKPNDVDIKRELQILQRRRDRGTEPKKGGGFFGKKK